MARITKTEDELYEVIDQAEASTDDWSGMTYQEGVAAALRWVIDGESHPMNED